MGNINFLKCGKSRIFIEKGANMESVLKFPTLVAWQRAFKTSVDPDQSAFKEAA